VDPAAIRVLAGHERHPAVTGRSTAADRSAALPQRLLLDRIADRARTTPEIAGLLVFGSFAAGTEDGHSDLDLGLYVDDRAWPEFDLRSWLEPVAPVAAVHVTEHCSIVLFRDLIRAEVHLGPSSRAEVWPMLAGVIAYPSLERMVLLDRTGTFSASVEPLIGRLPARMPADAEAAFLGLADGLLVADGCRRRGDLARALKHLESAQVELLRLVRYEERAFDEWVAPERSLAVQVTPAAFGRYRQAISRLDDAELRLAIARSWTWGAEIAERAGVRPFARETLAGLEARLAAAGARLSASNFRRGRWYIPGRAFGAGCNSRPVVGSRDAGRAHERCHGRRP
jgi:predicted nucleotidyltransferase